MATRRGPQQDGSSSRRRRRDRATARDTTRTFGFLWLLWGVLVCLWLLALVVSVFAADGSYGYAFLSRFLLVPLGPLLLGAGVALGAAHLRWLSKRG